MRLSYFKPKTKQSFIYLWLNYAVGPPTIYKFLFGSIQYYFLQSSPRLLNLVRSNLQHFENLAKKAMSVPAGLMKLVFVALNQ